MPSEGLTLDFRRAFCIGTRDTVSPPPCPMRAKVYPQASKGKPPKEQRNARKRAKESPPKSIRAETRKDTRRLMTNQMTRKTPPLQPQSAIRPPDVYRVIFLWLSKPFRPATGILPAALSRRSPLRLRQRRLPIGTAAKRNRFGL